MTELGQGHRFLSLAAQKLIILGLGLVGLVSLFLPIWVPFASYLALPLVVLVPGFSLTRHVAPRDLVVRITTSFPASLVVSSFYALLLAELGLLNRITILTGLFLISLFLTIFPRHVRAQPNHVLTMSRKTILVLLAAISISVISNLGLLILFPYPVGYDVWSYMATSKLIATSGSLPFWLEGSIGQLNFYPPLFPVYMGSLLLVTQASTVSLFWATPVFFGSFFVLSVFGCARSLFTRTDIALIAALLAATIGSSHFEGLDRAYPVSAAMITLPAFLLILRYFRSGSSSALLVASGCLAFLWLCFPPAALLAVLILVGDSLRHQEFSPGFPNSLKISSLSIVPAVVYYVPFLISYGIPKDTFFAPWTTSFLSETIFSTRFLALLFNYSGLIIPTVLGVAIYAFIRKVKLKLRHNPVLGWTIIATLLLIAWELLVQANLGFFGAVRFMPFVILSLCILTATWIAAVVNLDKLSFKRLGFRRSVFGPVLFALILVSSAAITANGNYHEWLPPARLPVNSSYYQAIAWIRDNSQRGAVVLTLDPLAQSLLEVIVGNGVHTTYDVTTYPFWVSKDVVKAYSDTITMLSGNSSSIQLLSLYDISYVLITGRTITLLSMIKGVPESQVAETLTAEFANNTRFRLVYSDFSAYQTQASLLWGQLQASSDGSQLQNLWNQLPLWTGTVFHAWLERFHEHPNEETWNELLLSVKSINAPDIETLAPTLSLSASLPIVYEVLRN